MKAGERGVIATKGSGANPALSAKNTAALLDKRFFVRITYCLYFILKYKQAVYDILKIRGCL